MNKSNITLSKVGISLSVVSTIGSVIYLVIAMYQANISNAIKFDTNEGRLQFDCYFMLATFIYFCTCINHNRHLALVNKIIQVSSILSKDELFKLAVIIYVKDTVGFLFLMAQIWNLYSDSIPQMISKIYGLYITICAFFIDIQYSDYVLILTSCFKNINNNLSKLNENSADKKNDECKNIGQRLQFDNIQLIKLRVAQHKHHDVNCAITELNSAFALQTIGMILLTFAEVTFGLYFFLLYSKGVKNIDIDKQIWFNYFLTSVIYHLIKVSIIIWICQKAKNESLNTGITVHDIILDSKNELLNAELSLFSVQLLQCNNDLNSKCFVMDAKLLTALVSGIATYLLILIQFLKTNQVAE